MEEKDTLLTVDEFATKIKEKYPEYKDVDNLTLANKIVEKYPEYKSKVSFEGTPEVKKKDSTQPVQTQPVQTQEAPTQAAPLPGLGGVSERSTPSPSVGIGKGVFPAKSPVQDLKESLQDPLLKAQERAKRQQLEPTSSQNLLRTEAFTPSNEIVEDADYKEWKSNLPENLQQETDGYDLYGAYKAGMEPIEVAPGEYHLSSRDPKTGRILKSEDHDTFYNSVIEDDKLGYVTYKSKDGNIYSKKQYEIDIAGDAQEIFRVDDTGAVVKEVVETGEVLTPVELDAKRRAVKLAGIRQELYEDIGDKLFDENYMSSSNVIDKYAPKDVKVREAQGDPTSIRFVDVMKRDQEKEDRYNLALNEAKKSLLQDKLYGLAESGDAYIDIAEADLDKVMQSYLDMSEYTDKKEGPSILYGKRVKKETGNIYEMLLPNHVEGSELKLDETISQWVDSKAEDMELSGEAKRMMKSQIKQNYKERKRLEAAANEVSKETGYNLDEVRGDVDKVVNEINSYENELKSIYTPYDVKAKKAQERMTLEFEQIQDRVINRVSNSQEYKDLLSEYQAKVNSGEITVEGANSAVSQKINIMLSESPEAVELQRKYQGVLSSYDSELRKRTEDIYSELQSSLDQLKGLSKQDEEYRRKLSDKVRQMYKDEQSEIDSDWKKLAFGGLITTEKDTKLGRGIRSGMGDLAASIAGGVEYLVGENTLSEKLASINNQIKSDNPMIDLGEFGFEEFAENPFNEDWWATRVAPSAPLTFSLMAPGIGVGAGTTALATRVGLTGLSRALVTGTVSGIGMRAMESFTEAGLQYYDLIERGESVDYASKQAAKTYSENMDLLALDVAEMTTFFLPASSRIATMAKFVAQVPMNAAEELLQERLPAEELAYNRYLKGELTQKEIAEGVSEYEKVFSGGKFSDIYNFLQTDQGQEVALIGSIYGGAFGGASLPGDISRTNSLRRLNNFLNEEIVRYSSTEVVRNAEGKPLEFGMGGVVAGPAETMQEAKNRRIWQLKSTLDEMQMKGLINEDDAKLGKKQVDFAFGVADQMPVNLPLVTRGQLLQKLTEIRDLEEGLEGMTNETLIDAQKKKIAKLKKESEEIIGGTAQGYFINNVSVTKEQFAKIASNPKFAEGVINGDINVTIMNDADTQKGFSEAVEGYKTDKESYESAMESLGVTKAVRDEVSGYNESVTKEGGIGAKIAPIMTRVENSERINEKEIDAAIDDIFAEIEAVQNSDLNEKTKEIITNTLYDTATQLDNYEFTTETRTKTVTQSRTAKNLGAFAEKVSVENFFDNAAGTIDGEENVRFTTDKGVVKATREDGTEFILDTPSMRIDDGDIAFDENGVLESVTVTDRSGTRVTFTGEIAMDLAIRDGQNKVGSVPEAALQQIITEEVQVEEEVLKKQPKTKKDAIQEQAAGEVPIQPEAKAGEKVEEGEPKAEPEVTTQKGKEKEVAPATQGIVSKLLEKVSNSNDDAVTKKRKRAALRAVANILNFKSNILPETKVKVHETDESYRSATGVDGPGVYDATNDTIHINLAHKEAGDETVYHEMIHPIIYNAVKNDTEARILTQRMVEGVVRSSGGNKAIVDKLKGWLEQYEASERPEETIAEVAGFLASEFKNLTLSAKNIIKDYLNKMARKFGGKDLFRAVSKDADVVKVLNRLSEAMRAGEAITAEDLTSGDFSIVLNQEKTPDLLDMALEEMAEEYGYEPGGIISGGIKQRISGMNNLKDSSFNTSYNYGTKLNMPEPRTVESVLEEAGGAAIFINSDGTGVFVSKDGKNLQGGWRYLYFDENTSKDVGFAATSGNHVNTFYDKVERIINYRDSKFPKQKGKPIATFVTIQNAESMLGEWYAGEFFMEGIDKAITDGKIKGGIDGARSLLIEAAEKIKKPGSKEFIELVNSEKFETKNGRLGIAKKLSSKDFSFGFRSKFFNSISPLKTISKESLNAELKKALRDVNHGRIDFYDTYTDEVLLEKLKDSNYNEKSIGGITLGGFFTDLSKSKKEFFDNRTSGLNHEMFNESFTSNGKTFLLDGGYNVSKMFPEMSFPTKNGYELYNKENNTNYSKEDAKKSPEIQLEISKFLLNKKEPFKNKLLADPFTSIAGTMYTSIAAPIGKQRKASPEKFVSELEKTKDSDPTQYWSVNYVSLSAAKKGKVISVDGGYGFVSNDGDIKGVFKLPTSKVKGVADNILQEAVNQGGTKLDNFDGYLTKIYERNGFRIAARIPFNEEIAPDGWNKAKHGTPDVVAMVYDPNNELGIKEKKFDDYDAGIEYRDSFLEDKAPAAKKPGIKQRKAISAHEETGFISTDFWVDNLRGKTKYLDDVVENILESREELKKGSVPIDKVTRAYLVTIGSVGSRGSYYENWSKKTGSTVDDIFLEKEKGREWIRPEGATAAYLVTDEGKKLVKDIQSGKATYDQVKKLFDFADFGRSNQKTEYVMNAISKGGIQSFNKSLNKNKGKDFNEIYSLAIKNLPGIAEGKTGFINQFFGVSTRGVIDARQLNAWVGGSMKLTDSQKQLRKKVESSDALKAELLNRIEKVGLELGYSEDIAAYIAHHAIWDKVANTITSHKGEYKVVSGKQRKAAPDQKVRASIDFKNRYGKYFTISKEFNNQKHLDNYISFMERKGNKEVGTETFPIGLKERKPLSKERKPRIKDGLEDSIDDQKKAGIIKRLIDSPGKIIRGTNKQLFDFRGELKDYMRNQEELEYAYYRTINALGSGGVAKLAFDKAYEKIYDGLGPTKRDDLDKIIIARRIISINQSRAFNNLDKIEGLFNSPPKFFTKKGGEYLASFEQTMIDLIDTVSNSPLLKDMIIEEAETLMSMMPVMNSIASNQNLTQKEILSEQNKVINELKNALDKVLKAENVTFTNNRGVKNGLNEAYELLDSKRNEIGDKVFDELNDRADKYFAKFQEMLDQDLADGIISQEQYDAMTGIEYSPRVFMQTVLDINDDIINSREGSEYVDRMLASNFGMNKDAIKTLRDGIDAKSKPDATDKAFFEMVTNSEVILGNYINSRERLRKMNDLNLYMANEITALETKLNTLSNKASLTNEEQMELETIKETLDAFSTKKSNGYLPVRYYENGVKKQFYIRGDLYNQWYNIRPGSLIGDSAVGKVVDKTLSSPVAVLKTFATGALSPLFGITASAIDLQQLMIFSDAKGFSEIMPLKAAQIAKDLVGVPFYQRGVIRSIISEDELFTEAVNEGIMMDFLYTQGGMADAAKLIRTGLESVIEKSDLGYAGYVRTRKALLKIAEATLILNKAAEIAPRLTAYQRTRDFEYAKIDKMVQQQGLSNEEEEKMRKNARIKAAAIARDLMNFSEGGESTKQLDKYSTYLNAAMQGTVTAAREYKKNPIRTTSRMAQSAAMFFGTVIGMASFLVWSLKDDDDDKKVNEIIKETRDNASDYVKQKYFLIPTGRKDRDGNYTSIRLKKHPQLVPFYEMFEIGYDNFLAGDDAVSIVSKENALRINHAFFDNALPMNISPIDKNGNIRSGWDAPKTLAQSNPIFGGGIEAITGYDLYRNRMIEPQTFNSAGTSDAVKGLWNPYTEDFYKSFALEMKDATGTSFSPAQYKHLVERMVTNPRNNLYVAVGYAALNQFNDLDITDKERSFSEDLYDMVSKKVIYSSSSRKGMDKGGVDEFQKELQALDDKEYLVKEAARMAIKDANKKGGFGKLANETETRKYIVDVQDRFLANMEAVSKKYPDMKFDSNEALSDYIEFIKRNAVLFVNPVGDESSRYKYNDILSVKPGKNKYRKMALSMASAFRNEDIIKKDPLSPEVIDRMIDIVITAENSKKKVGPEFVIEYIKLYNEKNNVNQRSGPVVDAVRSGLRSDSTIVNHQGIRQSLMNW
jgi:hypothetical protein